MSLRGSTTVPERIFASLPYLLPVLDGVIFGSSLFNQFPLLKIILLPLLPLFAVYNTTFLGVIPVSLIIFFALFALVVRNEKIAHFIRFNTMQAILLDIVIFLCSLLLRLLSFIPGTAFTSETLSSTIFLGTLIAVIYAVFQSLLGRYAEIPAISEAVYTQVR